MTTIWTQFRSLKKNPVEFQTRVSDVTLKTFDKTTFQQTEQFKSTFPMTDNIAATLQMVDNIEVTPQMVD